MGKMTKKQIRKKIMEMVRDDKKYIQEKVEKALKSRAFDIKDYEDDYRLPKIILHAIYKDLCWQRKPLYKEHSKIAENIYIVI